MRAATAPIVAVDVAALAVRAHALQVLVVRTRGGAYAGRWALPGGRVQPGEPLDTAARRELQAQTGIAGAYLEQLYTFGSPARDPQGHVVSVAYLALVASAPEFPAPRGAKYAEVSWRPVTALPRLAYDHRDVTATAIDRLRGKLQYTNLAYALLPDAFTLGEAHAVYEAILGRPLDRRNFRKKLLALGLLRSLGRTKRGAHRPAALHAFRERTPRIVAVL